jgi:thymidine kinase
LKRLGTLTVVCGSMFAGKTEELIRQARRALYGRKKVQVFKPAIDTRFAENMLVTHEGVRLDAIPILNVAEMKEKLDPDTDVICIEEAQFFDDSLVSWAVHLADNGKQVICAGLDQDFRRAPFGPMPLLLSAADEVVKLRAICVKCGRPASHTYRMIDGKPAKRSDPVILIGATETYEARCRACYRLR